QPKCQRTILSTRGISGGLAFGDSLNRSISAAWAPPLFPQKNLCTLFYLRNCPQRPGLLSCTRCGITNQPASHPLTLRHVEGFTLSNCEAFTPRPLPSF